MVESFLIVIVRVGALAIFVSVAQTMPQMFVDIAQAETSIAAWLNAVLSTLMITVPVLLLVFPKWLIPATAISDEPQAAPALDAAGLQVVGFSVIGLYLLTRGLIDAVYWVTFYRAALSYGMSLTPENLGYMFSTGLELAIGLLLFLARVL